MRNLNRKRYGLAADARFSLRPDDLSLRPAAGQVLEGEVALRLRDLLWLSRAE
jgi:hypothetical protein